MRTLLLCLLLFAPLKVSSAPLPQNLCEDLYESITMGVEAGILTHDEASWLYVDCKEYVERQGAQQTHK